MQIQNLLTKATDLLYHSIEAHYEVILQENPDFRAEAWTSRIDGVQAIIKYVEIEHPMAALAHELLHLDTQIKGFRPLVTAYSLSKGTQWYIPTLIKVLNATLMHHKMADPFLAFGYPPALFQQEEADFPLTYLQSELLQSDHHLIHLGVLYLTFLEPLNGISAEDKSLLQKSFMEYAGGIYANNFHKMADVLDQWGKADTYEAEGYFKDLLLAMGVSETWFSYLPDLPSRLEEDFPKAGFFVGEGFTLEELKSTYGI